MYTRNTIHTSTNDSLLDRAIHLLDTLESLGGQTIVHFLLEHKRSSFLELAIHTGFESEVLESHLEQLCALRLLRLHCSIRDGEWYEADVPFLQRVCKVARQLAAFHSP